MVARDPSKVVAGDSSENLRASGVTWARIFAVMHLIYADYAATTPVDPRVVEAITPTLTEVYYNASSAHLGGMMASALVAKARKRCAAPIGAQPDEIVFTSGATESINLAIQGLATLKQLQRPDARRRIISVRSEHSAVRDAVTRCADLGYDVQWVSVDHQGRVDLEHLARLCTPDTLLVSVMMVNNETGVVQDIAAISAIAHAAGAVMMSDATQAYGKMPVNVDELGIDLMPWSGHKIYGPKGIGALYVRGHGDHAVTLEPMVVGGGQERGVRSGTMNVTGIVGLGAASEISCADLESDAPRIRALRERFEVALRTLDGVEICGDGAPRGYNITNVVFHTMRVGDVLAGIPDVCCSRGSACHGASTSPSAALLAMGFSEAAAGNAARFSFGRFTTEADVDRLIAGITQTYAGLQSHT